MNLVLEAKTSSEGIDNHKIWYKLLIYHRIAIKLSSSEMENGKNQTPSYNKRGIF